MLPQLVYKNEINFRINHEYTKEYLETPSVSITLLPAVYLMKYRIAKTFRGVKFSWKLIRLSFCNSIFADSDPIPIINDVNIVSRIKIFAGRDKSVKTAKILSCETFFW